MSSRLSQDRGSACRQDAAHSGARLQRLVHGAFAAQWPRALIADVGWRAAAKRGHDILVCDHQPHRQRARARYLAGGEM